MYTARCVERPKTTLPRPLGERYPSHHTDKVQFSLTQQIHQHSIHVEWGLGGGDWSACLGYTGRSRLPWAFLSSSDRLRFPKSRDISRATPSRFQLLPPFLSSSLKNLLSNSLGRPSNRPSYPSEHLRNPSIGPRKGLKRP